MKANGGTQPKCVVLAGGGTGGHLCPGLAVADELRHRMPDAHIEFFGTGRSVERHLVPKHGYELRVMPAVQMPRSIIEMPVFPFKLWKSVSDAKAALKELNPCVVVGLGGYGSVPAVCAAHRLRIPSVLLEQNSVPGKANRWLARHAEEVYAQWPGSVSCFPHPDRVHVLGNPLREGITEGTREAGIMKFCLDPRLKTLLILGGSQGARRINEAVCDALESLSAAQSVQVIHQTGLSDIPWVVKRYAEASIVNHVSPFLDDMADALATSDLVLGRAGATTLAEVAAVGRASILVPYPHAADNHQYHNAKAFEDAGAAVLLQDSQLTGETLSRFVADLMNDEERRLGMAEAARGLARTGATQDVCDRIVAIISRRNP